MARGKVSAESRRPQPETELDLVVVGAGIVGLATAVAAQERGLEVRCIEAARPGAGQSAGRTRVFRHRHDRPELVELAVRARRGWRRWEARLGRPLLGEEGVLIAGPGLEDIARRFDSAGVEYSELDESGQRRVLPILGSLGAPALFDSEGGAIRAGAAVAGLAGWLGAQVVPAEVLGVHASADRLDVHTSEGIWRSRQAVLCAGADTARLARPLGLELPVRDGCVLRATFGVRDEPPRARLACLLDRRDSRPSGAYGSQCEGGPSYAVGLHSSELALPSGEAPIPAAESLAPALERTSRYVAETFPGLHPEPIGQRLCRTTRLPWGDDAFAAWRQDRVTVFAGNNAFQFAPVLGPLLVDAATSDTVPPQLAPRSEAAA